MKYLRVIPAEMDMYQERVFGEYGLIYHMTSTKQGMSFDEIFVAYVNYVVQYREDCFDDRLDEAKVAFAIIRLIDCGLLESTRSTQLPNILTESADTANNRK